MYIASKVDGGEREGQGVVPIDLLDYYLSLSEDSGSATELKENSRLLESQRREKVLWEQRLGNS